MAGGGQLLSGGSPPPAETQGGLPMVGGLGGVVKNAVQPAFQGEAQGGKAGVPTAASSNITPAAPQQPSTVGIGPPADMVRPTAQPSMSPIVQQMTNRMPMQPAPFNTGLQSLFNRFNIPQQPRMRPPMQMPVYRNPALSFRPNMGQIQQNLSRVKPSVYKSELDAAKARIAELEGMQSGGGDSGGGGGA